MPTHALAALAAVVALGQAPAGRPPNVVLIVADDLGPAELGSYGGRIIRTPNLDRLAGEGMRFTRFYSGSPVCAPARCTLLTGKHAGRAFIRDNGNPPGRPLDEAAGVFPGQHPIPDDEVTLAELFRRRGYATGAAGKWGLGFEGSSGDPLRQGFDSFLGYLCQVDAHNHYPRSLWRDGERFELPGNSRGATGATHSQELFTAEALRFVRAHRDRPFFLYLPLTIPHVSIQAPEEFTARYRERIADDPPFVNNSGRGYTSHPAPRAGYAAMVTYMDAEIGRLLDELRAPGLEGNTIVLFTSDNGPARGRVGGSDSAFFDSTGGLRGLKGSVYEGGLRVPLIARWPDRVPANATSDHVGYFPDLLPTLMDLIGAPEVVPRGLDGLSFAPALLGRPGEQPDHDQLYWEFAGYGGQQAVRAGRWKAVRVDLLEGRFVTELYDLEADPAETRDVAADHPEVVERLETLMRSERVPSALFPIPALDGGG